MKVFIIRDLFNLLTTVIPIIEHSRLGDKTIKGFDEAK